MSVHRDERGVEPPKGEARAAALSQLSVLVCQIVGPLAILVWFRRTRFVTAYAFQALVLQATYAASLWLAVNSVNSTAFTPAVVVNGCLFVYGLAVSMIGARKAELGETWRYPPFAPRT